MYSPHRARFATLLAIVMFAGCEQARISLTSPTPTSTTAADASALTISPDDVFGSVEPGVMLSAAVERDFSCVLGPFAVATNSHATISNSGNETVVCSGQLSASVVAPEKIFVLEGFACALRFGDGDPSTSEITFDSVLRITPSGHVTMVCKSER